MRVSYNEDLANHIDLEPCLDLPQGGGEALIGESAGKLFSSEITQVQKSIPWSGGEDNIHTSVINELVYILTEFINLACTEIFYTGNGRSTYCAFLTFKSGKENQ